MKAHRRQSSTHYIPTEMHIRTTAKQHITRETPATLRFNSSVRPWANRPVNSSRDSEYHGSGSTRMDRYE